MSCTTAQLLRIGDRLAFLGCCQGAPLAEVIVPLDAGAAAAVRLLLAQL